MHYVYKPRGVCASKICFDIEDNIVTNVAFTGGCSGNLKMVSKLVNGMTADEIAEKCGGNTCGMNTTSCADQLAQAVLAAKLAVGGEETK